VLSMQEDMVAFSCPLGWHAPSTTEDQGPSEGEAKLYHRGAADPDEFLNSNEKILYIVLIVPNDPSIFKEDPDGLLA
jgi:hypothetical protein